MTTYLLSYDLIGKGEDDYPPLLNALRSDGAVRILYSEWLIQTNETSAALRDRYRRHIDGNDRIFVCEVNANWAYINILDPAGAKRLLPAHP